MCQCGGESCGYGDVCRPVSSVFKLVGIECWWQACFNVAPDPFLKALHDDWCKCYWSVVIEAAGAGLFWYRDDCRRPLPVGLYSLSALF